MIVHENDSRARSSDGRPEHFTRMNKTGVQVAESNQVISQCSSAGVHNDNDERFFAWIEPGSGRNGCSPVIDRQLRSVHVDDAGGTLPNPHHFELIRWFLIMVWLHLLKLKEPDQINDPARVDC